jgi:magnesium-transporting ATPase (P-type)
MENRYHFIPSGGISIIIHSNGYLWKVQNMKMFSELTNEEKERQLCFETSRSRLENIINSDIITAFIFLAILITMVFTIFGFGVTSIVTSETMESGSFSLGVTMLQASLLVGFVGMFFFLAIFVFIIYKRDKFRKRLFAVYEMDEDMFKVKDKDLKKIRRTWKKEEDE